VKDLKERTIRGGAARLVGQAARALVRLVSVGSDAAPAHPPTKLFGEQR